MDRLRLFFCVAGTFRGYTTNKHICEVLACTFYVATWCKGPHSIWLAAMSVLLHKKVLKYRACSGSGQAARAALRGELPTRAHTRTDSQ